MIAGSHRQEEFPSDAIVLETETPVAAPAGSYLVLDCMLYHTGGVNRTGRARRAVNHVYTLPFIKQQISLPRCIPPNLLLLEEIARLFGFGDDSPDPPAQYYKGRLARMKQA